MSNTEEENSIRTRAQENFTDDWQETARRLYEAEEKESGARIELDNLKKRLEEAYHDNISVIEGTSAACNALVAGSDDERLAIARMHLVEQATAIEMFMRQSVVEEQHRRLLVRKIEELETFVLTATLDRQNLESNVQQAQEQQARHKQETQWHERKVKALQDQIYTLQQFILQHDHGAENSAKIQAALVETQDNLEIAHKVNELLSKQVTDAEVRLQKADDGSHAERQVRDWISDKHELQKQLLIAVRNEEAITADYFELSKQYQRRFHERNVYLAQLRDTDTVADAVTQGADLPEELTDDRKILHCTISKLKRIIHTLQQDAAFRIEETQDQYDLCNQDHDHIVDICRDLEEQHNIRESELRQQILDIEWQHADLEALRDYDLVQRPWIDTKKYDELQKTNQAMSETLDTKENEIALLKEQITELERKSRLQIRAINDQIRVSRMVQGLSRDMETAKEGQMKLQQRISSLYHQNHGLLRERDALFETSKDKNKRISASNIDLRIAEAKAAQMGEMPGTPLSRMFTAGTRPSKHIYFDEETIWRQARKIAKEKLEDPNYSAKEDFDARTGYPSLYEKTEQKFD
jgi:hypothetical protein